MAIVEITKQFRFEASHVLPRHPGKCSRLHGHSWELEVSVEGEINKETGFVCDFFNLKQLVDDQIISRLDHTHLGKGNASHAGKDSGSFPPFGEDFYPSSENLVVAIARILQPLIKEINPDGNIRLTSVKIKETCTSAACWRAPAAE